MRQDRPRPARPRRPFADLQAGLGVATIRHLLRNEASVDTVYYNRREAIEGNGPGGARPATASARARSGS
jgi:hypothetical protein